MKYIFLSISVIFSTTLIAQDKQEHWQTFFAQYDKGPGSTLVNMSLKDQAPLSQFPFLIQAGVKINHCNTDGFPEHDEWDILHRISDAVKAVVDVKEQTKTVGTFTYQCWRTDYLYIADTNMIRDRLMKVFKDSLPDHEYKIEIKADPNWEAYLGFLYPKEETLEYISNQQIVLQLEKSGDKLDKPRLVDHWLYFKTVADRKKFVEYAVQQNFTIEGQELSKKSDLSFGLHISRVDKVDIQSISVVTLQLRKKAKELGGDYDGWETFVIKEK